MEIRSAVMRVARHPLATPRAALIKASMSFVEINRRRQRLDQRVSRARPGPRRSMGID
jgi:hypothetical protein